MFSLLNKGEAEEPSLPIRYFDGSCYVNCWDGNKPEFSAHIYRAVGWVGEDNTPMIHIERQKILDYTPCGVWIECANNGKKKFVNLKAGKQWASATVQEAIDQLYYRKRKQVRILEHQLSMAKDVLEAMKTAYNKKEVPRSLVYYDESYYL